MYNSKDFISTNTQKKFILIDDLCDVSSEVDQEDWKPIGSRLVYSKTSKKPVIVRVWECCSSNKYSFSLNQKEWVKQEKIYLYGCFTSWESAMITGCNKARE